MEKSRDINRSEGDQRGVGGGERERGGSGGMMAHVAKFISARTIQS